MNTKSYFQLTFLLFGLLFFASCSSEEPLEANYSFETAQIPEGSQTDISKLVFSDETNLDLGFYTGQVWIKLQIQNGETPANYVVLCNDLINHYYRFYRLDTLSGKLEAVNKGLDTAKNDHRSVRFAKPNFRIDLASQESATYYISTSSDSRILQASPSLISLTDFIALKQNTLFFDLLFYSIILLLLLINLFYFRLIRTDIYYYYGAYIVFGCLMYLFVEGRLYGLGLSHLFIDHLMFISIRLWILSSILFTTRFLETKTTNPVYYKFIVAMLMLSLGGSTLYQLAFYNSSVATLHEFENYVGFFWILISLTTVAIAFRKRKVLSLYYLISFSLFLLFVTLGLIDSHATILPGDPFSYFKIGTILEFIGFTYFITYLVKQKLRLNEKLEKELSEKNTELQVKEKLLVTKNTDLASIFKLIENSLHQEEDWDDFKKRFEALDTDFMGALAAKHGDLSKSESRLLTLIRIGYSQKEIADILNIAPDSVKKARTRVRKKLGIPDSVQLYDYLLEI
ncbi:MAG: hypothetical protein EP332_09635 [Bacteroidetes bacterium]|nr:MAG: hypothetical protein EP332_09635 [Bacteroidota bacterium]